MLRHESQKRNSDPLATLPQLQHLTWTWDFSADSEQKVFPEKLGFPRKSKLEVLEIVEKDVDGKCEVELLCK